MKTLDMNTIIPTKDHAREVVRLLGFGLVRGLGVQEPGKFCVEAAVCCALGLPHSDRPPCVARSVRSFKIALNDSCWSSDQARAKGLQRLAVAQLGSDTIDERLFVKELALSAVKLMVPIALRANAKRFPKRAELYEKHALVCEQSKNLRDGEKNVRAAADADADAAAYVAAADAAAAAYVAAAAAADADADAAAYAAAAYAAAAYVAAAAADADAAAASADAAAVAAAYVAAAAADADAAAAAAAYVAAADADAVAAARDHVLGIMAEAAVQALIKCGSPGCQWLDLCEAPSVSGALPALNAVTLKGK